MQIIAFCSLALFSINLLFLSNSIFAGIHKLRGSLLRGQGIYVVKSHHQGDMVAVFSPKVVTPNFNLAQMLKEVR
jgi:hypothetical protein